jgi:HK97 gp10 family phage protein
MKPDRVVIEAMARTPSVMRETRRTANQVRAIARRNAPKRTGAGARSITVDREFRSGSRTGAFLVSWDRRHFYMVFNEDGSRTNRARHFLRRAAEEVNNRSGSAGNQ